MNIFFYSGLFALGAIDALQPGHSKSILSSYLVGTNAKIYQIMLLALIVTLTHVVVNGILAYAIIWFASSVFEQNYIQYIDLLAGGSIVLLAIYLIWQRFFAKEESACCGCDHSHQNNEEASKSMPFWQVLVLGVTGGLVPCPVVLTALISAVSSGKALEALFGITIFSLGMGTVIFMVGLVTLLGLSKMSWFNNPENTRVLGQLSAVTVLLLGIAMVTNSLLFYEVEDEPPISLIMIEERK